MIILDDSLIFVKGSEQSFIYLFRAQFRKEIILCKKKKKNMKRICIYEKRKSKCQSARWLYVASNNPKYTFANFWRAKVTHFYFNESTQN